MTPQEIEVRDMRKVAIHEMGHTVVARHYGMVALPIITPTITTNPLEERTWVGSTGYDTTHMTSLRRRRCAIAGMVAEFMDKPNVSKWALEEALESSYYNEEWSPSDLEAAEGWSSADFRAVYSILKRNWAAIEKGAASLVRKAA